MIYEPAEDSYLLQKELKNFIKPGMKVLDMGTGSGILAETSKTLGAEVYAVDINPLAVKIVKKIGIDASVSNLFSKINKKFDFIIFNPPYLPEDTMEPEDSRLATTGGKDGNEIIEKFLKNAKEYLFNEGKIILLFSSLTPDVINLFKKYGYFYKKISEKKIPFETLYVYILS